MKNVFDLLLVATEVTFTREIPFFSKIFLSG